MTENEVLEEIRELSQREWFEFIRNGYLYKIENKNGLYQLEQSRNGRYDFDFSNLNIEKIEYIIKDVFRGIYDFNK